MRPPLLAVLVLAAVLAAAGSGVGAAARSTSARVSLAPRAPWRYFRTPKTGPRPRIGSGLSRVTPWNRVGGGIALNPKAASVVLVFAAVLAVAFLAVPSYAARPGVCPSMIRKSTTLKASCTGPITIARSGVTLDCAGFTVSGALTQNGVTLGPGIHGVTVENCVVTGFGDGFLLDGASSNLLQGNTATADNTSFELVSSNANNLTGNVADGNFRGGFLLESSSFNRITFNVADNDNAFGFDLVLDSSNNTLSQNVAFSDHFAFALTLGAGNRLTANNGSAGDYGFVVDQTSANVLTSNRADANTADGFSLSSSTSGNALVTNEARDNGGFGFDDSSSGSGTAGTANTYSGDTCTANTLGGSSPAGLCT